MLAVSIPDKMGEMEPKASSPDRHILSTIPYEQKQLRSRCWITCSPLIIYIVDWSMRFREKISLRT